MPPHCIEVPAVRENLCIAHVHTKHAFLRARSFHYFYRAECNRVTEKQTESAGEHHSRDNQTAA